MDRYGYINRKLAWRSISIAESPFNPSQKRMAASVQSIVQRTKHSLKGKTYCPISVTCGVDEKTAREF
jgi:hypothetical protein